MSFSVGDNVKFQDPVRIEKNPAWAKYARVKLVITKVGDTGAQYVIAPISNLRFEGYADDGTIECWIDPEPVVDPEVLESYYQEVLNG